MNYPGGGGGEGEGGKVPKAFQRRYLKTWGENSILLLSKPRIVTRKKTTRQAGATKQHQASRQHQTNTQQNLSLNAFGTPLEPFPPIPPKTGPKLLLITGF